MTATGIATLLQSRYGRTAAVRYVDARRRRYWTQYHAKRTTLAAIAPRVTLWRAVLRVLTTPPEN